ncbi:MAG: biotin/lipoyl-containing protein [Dehalococcoidia bacterium]
MAEKYLVTLGDLAQEVEVAEGEEGLRARVGDQWHRVSLEGIGPAGLLSLLVDGRTYEVFAERRSGGFNILIGPRLYAVAVETERGRRRGGYGAFQQPAGEADWMVVSPMTGVVVEVRVEPGQPVEAGAVLLVIEAMKMNNEIRAQRAGTAEAVYVQRGQRITQGTTMLLLR